MALWISHRGESADAPENTMPAFQLASERNTDGTETDIHLTADNVLICCHDADAWRTCQGVHKIIEEMPYDELLKLDASYNKTGFGEVKLPLFSDALNTIGNRLFYVEIKENDPRVIDAMMEEVKKSTVAPEQIVMISFHSDIVRIFKEKYPQQKAYWLFSLGGANKEEVETKIPEYLQTLKEIRADGADLFLPPDWASAEFVKTFHDAGLDLAVWTVDQLGGAKNWIAAGADAITSNCAAKLRDALKD